MFNDFDGGFKEVILLLQLGLIIYSQTAQPFVIFLLILESQNIKKICIHFY